MASQIAQKEHDDNDYPERHRTKHAGDCRSALCEERGRRGIGHLGKVRKEEEKKKNQTMVYNVLRRGGPITVSSWRVALRCALCAHGWKLGAHSLDDIVWYQTCVHS